jgi:hypothetical protein
MRWTPLLCLVAALVAGGCNAPASAPSRPAIPAAGSQDAQGQRPQSVGPSVGTLSDLIPDKPYQPSTAFVPVEPRSNPVIRKGACADGRDGFAFAAIEATGPADDREEASLVEGTLCPEAFTAAKASLPGAKWARTATRTLATVYTAEDYSDQVGVLRDGRRMALPDPGGYSSNIPVPFNDGSVAMAVADESGMRVVLLRSSGDYATIATSPTTINAFDYTPSGKRFLMLDRLGVAGASAGTRLTVASSSATKQYTLTMPLAVHLLAIDENHAIVADIASRPEGASVIVDLNTGLTRPLARGLFPIVYDGTSGRALMRDTAGKLFWLDVAAGTRQAVAHSGPARIVGGDFLR